VRRETRHGVQAFDLSPKLERELAVTLREYGELDARGAGVQNENRVGRFAHGCRSLRREKSNRRTECDAGAPAWQMVEREDDIRSVVATRVPAANARMPAA
jgi:hypothetical protein